MQTVKWLLVEKPLGLDGAQALRLAKAANASGKVSACACYRRFSSQYLFTKAAIEKGDSGTPVGGILDAIYRSDSEGREVAIGKKTKGGTKA